MLKFIYSTCYSYVCNIMCSSLGELGEANHLPVLIMHQAELPVARLGVHDHLVDDRLMRLEIFHVYFEF